MPVNHPSLGALPARFRRPRLLIVGCGDVGGRVLQQLAQRVRCVVLTSQPARVPALRALGCTPLVGDLDQPPSLRRLAGLASRVLHLAPPPGQGDADTRTRALLVALRERTKPVAVVYGSTSGVYGDCAGAWVAETRPMQAQTARARRRVDAELQLRAWGRSSGVAVVRLRIPGIYGPQREGGPLARLHKGTPVLHASEDVYTNHIHADDLARACWLAVWRGRPQRVYHVCDDSELLMGAYLDAAADYWGLARPQRVSRAEMAAQVSPMQLSFMQESRRLHNDRMKLELGLRLRYPTVREGFTTL